MTPRVAIALVAGALGGVSAIAGPCLAQTLSIPSSTQNEVALNPAAGSQLSTTPGTVTPVTPNLAPQPGLTPGVAAPTSGVTQSSSAGNLFGAAGRGLPGMSGGSPLNAPMGAQDLSTRYMRPPVIGPLECDLSLDPACL